MRRCLALLLACVAAVVTLSAQTITPIIAIVCTDANFPDCGFPGGSGYWGEKVGTTPGVYKGHNVSRVGNGARFSLTPQTTQMQFYMGWQPVINSTATDLFIRYKLTINAPFLGNGVGDVWTDKFILANNGGALRAIGELRPITNPDNSDVSLGIQMEIQGPPSLTPRQNLVIGHQYCVQMRLTRGTSVRFAQWLDNSNQASPTSQSTANFSFNVASWQNVGIGFYSNAAVSSAGRVDFTLTDIIYDDVFDPNYCSAGPPPATAPLPPSLIRIS